jgi:hypothetical protein
LELSESIISAPVIPDAHSRLLFPNAPFCLTAPPGAGAAEQWHCRVARSHVIRPIDCDPQFFKETSFPYSLYGIESFPKSILGAVA